MNPITFPLKPQMQGPEVSDLHNALQLFIEKAVILRDEEGVRREISVALQSDRADQKFGGATRKLVSIFQREQGLGGGGTVDEPTAKAMNRLIDELTGTGEEQLEFAVEGTVRFFDGFPAAGFAVSAFDRDLRTEQALEQSRTNQQGVYQIRYSASQFRKTEKGSADLVVKIFAADGSLLAASPVLFNAPPDAVVDVIIPAEVTQPPALFEKIQNALKPLLEGVRVGELEEDREHQDLSFLAGETGIDKETLARFAMAHRLAREGIRAEFWFVLLGGSFYQFTENQSLKEDLVTVLDALPTLDKSAVDKALTRGFNQKEIPESFRDQSADWIERFLKLIAGLSMTGSAGPTFVKLALEHASITGVEKQEKFARLFNEYKSLTPELIDALENDRSFGKEETADLRASFQLGDLTGGDFSVVRMIKEAFGVRRHDQIRTLAKKSEGEWVELVKAKHAAGAIRLPIEGGDVAGQARLPDAEVYGKMLERQFREAFPTTAFAGGLDRALQNGGAHGLRRARDIQRFLERHEQFELLNTSVGDFFNTGIHPDFQNLAKDETFRREVKAVQRVFKLAPTFEATDALLADDLHSAQKIYRLGKAEFVRRYAGRPGFTPETARLAWSRAADTHAAVLTIVADLKALEAETLPAALKNDSDALSNFPNWSNLFKSGDLCQCEHCRSVLSPAAYFAELLTFLRDRRAVNPAETVKDILFKRRPDLGFLELNCDNALVPLPYIDVVCEVLEDVVAQGENDLELSGFTDMPSDPSAAKAAVAAAFVVHGIGLGDNFSLSQVNSIDPDRWVAHGEEVTYLLKKKATPHFFAEILRNTKVSAAQLRAYSQYVNPKAYAKLRQATYPLGLPFDLFAEEVRAAFQKTNLKRWDLMRTLRGAAPYNPTDGDIAAEYFGISTDPSAPMDEKRLILVNDATVVAQQAVWGEAGADWLHRVGNVRNFLRKTGLEFNELLALIDLKFINPAGDIAVHHLDPTCDTDQKTIQVLDEFKLDRIHRFLRLWRKLKGWKIWELDLVIRHPRIGNGSLDETFLINLFYVSQLKNRLGGKITIEQVCALFGDLNTETRFTRLREKREDALYQNLFLNTRLINPLDPAFRIDPATGDLAPGDTLIAHHPVIQAALGIRETDLLLFKVLTKPSDGTPLITDDLNLANLSFLWRHAWLSRMMKFKAPEWKTLLKLFQHDILAFTEPEAAWKFVEDLGHLRNTGFTVDQLNWLLAADRSTQAATREIDAGWFLSGLRKGLQDIRAQYDPGQYAFLTVPDVEGLVPLLMSLLQQMNRDEGAVQFFIAVLKDEVRLERRVEDLPAGFDFPEAIRNTIRIRYGAPAATLRFTGVMTAAERVTLLTDPSLAAVTGIAAYQAAIEAFFIRPRLELKFYETIFTAPLSRLPAVDFTSLSDPALALKISYDAEACRLRFAGIITGEEKAALDALSPDPAYRNAINSLANQPELITPPDKRIWLLDSDLQFPLRNHIAANLVTAVNRGLVYLSKTLSEGVAVRQTAAELGLNESLTRYLLTQYPVLPDTLLAQLTGPFAATTGAVDYLSLKTTFDGWFWANRTAAMLKKWKIAPAELEQLTSLAVAAQLLDLPMLPLDSAGATAPMDLFLRTGRLRRLKDSLPETDITLIEIMGKLAGGTYATAGDFAADVTHLNPSWIAADVETLTGSLDLAYPDDYLLAESWERLRRVFYFIETLNSGAASVQRFAAPAMTGAHARTIKELLRSKFGTENWLQVVAEIQDILRERKRDALTAFLLAQPEPVDPPSGKWENPNDLYAYYLLDTEMSACLLTSRLVQGSGSVQLFVQRCFMGLEPEVAVNTDGPDDDSAWRWWKWMRKYRVWEANRKVFLWPENWIEPELKKDRSPFFKDLENELLQNDVNPYTVETAFTNYLAKLDGVAQLEIAGFYQEDDGDNAIIHVFGRTSGAEPHLYYYRRFDYRQWTPWEKVELDIQGDYLVPAVVNKRLFLFWPIFTEVPDEAGNSKVRVPKVNLQIESEFSIQQTQKRLRLQMAVSEYRQGQWMPKKVSKDFYESGWFTTLDTVRKFYHFIPIDRSAIDGRFFIRFGGYSLGRDGYEHAELHGAFEIADCNGLPALSVLADNYKQILRPEWASVGWYANKSYTAFMKWTELGNPDEFGHLVSRHDSPQNDFTLENSFAGTNDGLRYTPVLLQTPWLFRMSPPWHLSYFDQLILDGLLIFGSKSASGSAVAAEIPAPFGSWLPFFYNDKKRTFFTLPSIGGGRVDRLTRAGDGTRFYYPDIKKTLRRLEDYYDGLVQTWVGGLDLVALTPDQRQQVEQALRKQFPEEILPPYSDKQVKHLLKRWVMRFYHFYLGALSLRLFQFRRFHFKNFYHPFACDFAKLVYNPLKGIPALMSRETQLKQTEFSFRQSYVPTAWVVEPNSEAFYPKETVDFDPDGAYAPYNWELFFHAPLLIANSLSKNQRFEEARDWYHFIFNPIGLESSMPGGSAMSKYWITKPFFETADPQYVQQRIENILRMLAGDTSVPGFSPQAKKALEDQVRDWRTNPFDPHRIANYRTIAYQKTVVIKYLDNLIAWGDHLFRQDSMESINEATQLYIMAAEILGPRPKKIPPQAGPPVDTFNELEEKFDQFSNALVEVENLIPVMPGNGGNGMDPAPLPTLYFCIPQNDKMMGYWDTVADRLFKIRHCMNIEGVVRQLALFEPPIDPGALVKAVAAGVDIGSALADLNAPLPLYRFNVMLQKANELCADLKALGGALLAALEKKDAEALGLLRQGQEIRVLEAVRAVREKQIEEAQENLAGLKKGREQVQIRQEYFESQEFMNFWEISGVALSGVSLVGEGGAAIAHALSGGAFQLPQVTLGTSGFGGSPVATVTTGGQSIGDSAKSAANVLNTIARLSEKAAAMAAVQGNFHRRQDEWDFQKKLAVKEIEQIKKSIAAAELRVAIAEKELENHLFQIENAEATDNFMRSKYTNQELFQWQVGQISGVYFQSYQLAYDLAKQAERCFRFELGLQDSSYIQFGYWDSLKKGLLAGEKLQCDLHRIEAAYLEQNRREFELTKSVSLLLLDPLALVKLRETGKCFFRLPEEIYDLDYPGHYFRRIKSVSISLPCVVGPYTTISCTLRLFKNSVRINTADGDNGYPRNNDDQGLPADDDRFVENNIPVKAIAASHGQNDSGMFELSFRDDRYLPFEGAGVISEWSLELFNDNTPDFGKPLRQFDYRTISDAIVHVKYTAREDAGAFKNAAVEHLRDYFSKDGQTPSLRLFNLRQEFPTEWQRFVNPADPSLGNLFKLEMMPTLFPLRDQGKTLKVNTIWLLARCTDPGSYTITMNSPLPVSTPLALTSNEQYGGLHFCQMDVPPPGIEIAATEAPVTWQLTMTRDGNLIGPEVEEILLVLGYERED